MGHLFAEPFTLTQLDQYFFVAYIESCCQFNRRFSFISHDSKDISKSASRYSRGRNAFVKYISKGKLTAFLVHAVVSERI